MMKTAFATLVLLAWVTAGVVASDPDPLIDEPFAAFTNGASATSPDFVNTAFRTPTPPAGVGNRKGLSATFVNVGNFPALKNQGLAMSRFEMAPGSQNPPHVHVRGSEILTVIEGTVMVGVVDTAGKVFTNILKKGDTTIFPRGLVHFQLNVGTKPALCIAVVNSELQGALFISEALFSLPDKVKTGALQTSQAIIDGIEKNLGLVGV